MEWETLLTEATPAFLPKSIIEEWDAAGFGFDVGLMDDDYGLGMGLISPVTEGVYLCFVSLLAAVENLVAAPQSCKNHKSLC